MRGGAGEGVRGRDKASRQMPGRTAYLHFLCCFIQHSVLTTGKQSTLASEHAYKTRHPGGILNTKDKEKYSEHSGRKYRLLTKEQNRTQLPSEQAAATMRTQSPSPTAFKGPGGSVG